VPTTNGVWSTEGERTRVDINVVEHDIGAGSDLAIGISTTGDLTDDVIAYIDDAGLPIATFANIMPVDGPWQSALADDACACGWADATVTEIRKLINPDVGRVHVFIFGPNGASVLLGNLWNRMPPTQLYDDLGPAGGYTPSFSIA
jgi:hypothetical protein